MTEKINKRTKTVLVKMEELEYITKEQKKRNYFLLLSLNNVFTLPLTSLT